MERVEGDGGGVEKGSVRLGGAGRGSPRLLGAGKG